MAELEIHEMADELRRAGWEEKTHVIWRAPNGSLHLGPAGAWRLMKRQPRESPDVERGRLIARAMKLRLDIEQIFIDCESWNGHSKARLEGCDPIDCDPDGQLRRIAHGIDRMLATEALQEGK